MKKAIDIKYVDLPGEIIIHCNSLKAAAWFCRNLTTNVAPLHCPNKDTPWKPLA